MENTCVFVESSVDKLSSESEEVGSIDGLLSAEEVDSIDGLLPRSDVCISIVLTILFFLNGGGRQSTSKLVSAVVLLVVDVREDADDRIWCF